MGLKRSSEHLSLPRAFQGQIQYCTGTRLGRELTIVDLGYAFAGHVCDICGGRHCSSLAA